MAVIALMTRPLRIRRDPTREKLQDDEASTAYDRVGNWPVFALGRYLVLRPLARIRPHGFLVDIGCGPGHLTAEIGHNFRDLDVVGVDISPIMARLATHKRIGPAGSRLNFIIADGEALPMPDNCVDVIVSSLSLHHWLSPEKAIAEMRRVLKPGGRLLIFDLRRDSPRFALWAFVIGQALFLPGPIRHTNGAVGSLWSSYTARELAGMLSGLSFSSTRIDRRPAWLLCLAVK
jgi:ubiquinone/menaquinone biosynthesis C-methylase UbiE